MNLREIAKALDLGPVSAEERLERQVTGCYACDIMSRVMRGAHQGDLWLTVQAHANVVAIAALLDLAGVVIAEGTEVEPQTIAKANADGVVLLTTPLPSYSVAVGLAGLGVGRPASAG